MSERQAAILVVDDNDDNRYTLTDVCDARDIATSRLPATALKRFGAWRNGVSTSFFST